MEYDDTIFDELDEGPNDATERRRMLNDLEDQAIEDWQHADGQSPQWAVLWYQGVPLAVVTSTATWGLEVPVDFALSMGIADCVTICHPGKVSINTENTLVLVSPEGMDAMILVVVTAREPTMRRVVMAARHDDHWIFERLAAIENGSKELFYIDPEVDAAMPGFEPTQRSREDAWEVLETNQERYAYTIGHLTEDCGEC